MAEIHLTFGSPVLRSVIRLAMSAAFVLMRAQWFITRPRTHGASAFCFTTDGRLLLVWSTYEHGWNLPSGGRRADEPAVETIVRELREEIGLRDYVTITPLTTMEHRPNYKRDAEEIFHLTGVRFTPPRSLEIERIGLFAPEALPPEASAELRQRLALCGPALGLVQTTG